MNTMNAVHEKRAQACELTLQLAEPKNLQAKGAAFCYSSYKDEMTVSVDGRLYTVRGENGAHDKAMAECLTALKNAVEVSQK